MDQPRTHRARRRIPVRRGVCALLVAVSLGCTGTAYIINDRDARRVVAAQSQLRQQLREQCCVASSSSFLSVE